MEQETMEKEQGYTDFHLRGHPDLLLFQCHMPLPSNGSLNTCNPESRTKIATSTSSASVKETNQHAQNTYLKHWQNFVRRNKQKLSLWTSHLLSVNRVSSIEGK